MPRVRDLLRIRTICAASCIAALAAACDNTIGPWEHPPRLAFTCVESTTLSGICAENEDGTRRVTIVPPTNDYEMPSWSPDARRIVFVAASSGALFIAPSVGGDVVPLGNGVYGAFPAWSPDGVTIAFASGALWTVHDDATGLTRLTTDTMIVDRPSWSPDGNSIAFGARNASATYGGVFVVSASGGPMTQVTTHAGDGYPSWSPDGTRLVFANGGSLEVVGADGSGRSVLATPQSLGGWTATEPAWSPDGSVIAFVTTNGGATLWLMNADGTAPHPIPTTTLTGERDPAWMGDTLR